MAVGLVWVGKDQYRERPTWPGLTRDREIEKKRAQVEQREIVKETKTNKPIHTKPSLLSMVITTINNLEPSLLSTTITTTHDLKPSLLPLLPSTKMIT